MTGDEIKGLSESNDSRIADSYYKMSSVITRSDFEESDPLVKFSPILDSTRKREWEIIWLNDKCCTLIVQLGVNNTNISPNCTGFVFITCNNDSSRKGKKYVFKTLKFQVDWICIGNRKLVVCDAHSNCSVLHSVKSGR